jgi:hypothetical protein
MAGSTSFRQSRRLRRRNQVNSLAGWAGQSRILSCKLLRRRQRSELPDAAGTNPVEGLDMLNYSVQVSSLGVQFLQYCCNLVSRTFPHAAPF